MTQPCQIPSRTESQAHPINKLALRRVERVQRRDSWDMSRHQSTHGTANKIMRYVVRGATYAGLVTSCQAYSRIGFALGNVPPPAIRCAMTQPDAPFKRSRTKTFDTLGNAYSWNHT
eukprot:360527-Chlamydomonas_euryale.AAC.5